MKEKMFATIKILLLIFAVWLVLTPNISNPRVLAQYSWTDNIEIYKDVTVEYINIRSITNNETFPIDVKVYVTYVERIDLLQQYVLSANGTDFIIISDGTITRSENTYQMLQPGQKLLFTVKAKPTSAINVGDIITVQTKVELYRSAIIHDVAVIKVTPSKSVIGQEFTLRVNATVQNQGDFAETFDVTAYANTTIIQTKTVTLTSGSNTTITFDWDTTSVAKGIYAISAVADTVSGETDTPDNTCAGGTVFVTIPGDINGDRWVDGLDLTYLGFAWRSHEGEPRYDPNADITCDGWVDGMDLTYMGFNWRKHW